MNIPALRKGALAATLTAGVFLAGWHFETKAAESRGPKVVATRHTVVTKTTKSFDQTTAATYLDRRLDWWTEWPRAQRDHDTFCVSCHTAVPYAVSRHALRQALGEKTLSANEQRLLDNVTKRVRLWKEVAPFYNDAEHGIYKSVESRGTESVLNALILSTHDAETGKLSDDTRTAFDSMWAEQQTSEDKEGAWLWLRFNNEPWEADDSGYYGAALAAVAVGSAPENYRASPEIQPNLKKLRQYLNRESAKQTAINRAVLLWAAARMPGLIEPEQQKAIITELQEKQQADGGWSLASMVGDWKRHDGTQQEVKSDGYATGLVTFALQQAGVPAENSQLQRGLAWLIDNQDKKEGFWPGYSLNKNREHHISPQTALFMNDASTAYAVLALSEASRH